MTETLSIELVEAFSTARLRRYLRQGENYKQAFARYQENIRLSASLLPALHYLEVILRNRLDCAIQRLYGANWLRNIPTSLPMEYYNREKITAAIDTLQGEKNRKASHDDLVAVMTFGFWCALFHKRYDPALWHRTHFFTDVFPNWPREQRKRSVMQAKLSVIKNMRNRIAHHEPIFDWKPGIEIGHKLCVELIGAMSPDALPYLREVDSYYQLWGKA